MSWKELIFEAQGDGQTSFVKPADFPDITGVYNCEVSLDGRRLLPTTYVIECDGALVRIGADLPKGATVEVRYRVW